jgi:predicted ArsR family transcriptional regulator
MKNKDPWSEIDLIVKSSTKAPEGWLHREQLAKRWECSCHAARRKAESLVTSGFMEAQTYKANNGQETTFYRPLVEKRK